MKSIARRTTATALLLVVVSAAFLALPVVSQDAVDAPAPPDPSTSPPTASPEDAWGGCVDPENGYQLVTIGQKTTICLVLANNGDWSTETDYMRVNFQPIADEYSRFHVPESFQQLVGSPNEDLTETFPGNITVHAESQTALSFQKLYYGSDDKIYPYLTAVITVNEGVVTGITWDNACVFCSPEECQDNTYGYDGKLATEEEALQPIGACSMPILECKTSDKAKCDLLLYVVWAGTDSNGRDFTSSANRFSAFPKQTFSDMFDFSTPDWINKLNPFGGDDSSITTDETSN